MSRRTRDPTGDDPRIEIERLRTQLRDSRAALESELDVYRSELETANDELRAAAGELEASRDRFIELYDLAPVAYLTLDRFGLITELNLPAAALFEEVRAHVIRRPLMSWVAHHERRVVLDHLRHCRAGHGPVATELLLQLKSGRTVPVEITSRGAHDSGHSTQFHSVLLDLSERKRASEALRRSERLAALGTLTAGLAHEVKNPLYSMLLSAQTLRRDAGAALTPEQTHLLEDIAEDVHRCNRIIRNVLMFARNEPTERWPADLNVIVRRAVGLVRTYRFNCELGVDLANQRLWIRANPTEIEQVLLNLIKNAAEHGTPAGPVTVRTSRDNEHATLLVADNGPGIARENLPHIFDPFFTTRRGRGGTGLGLSLVHTIITEHGGEVRVESEPGRGTQFHVALPLVHPIPDVPRQSSE
jgi:PAS domain S-box-containing protein